MLFYRAQGPFVWLTANFAVG